MDGSQHSKNERSNNNQNLSKSKGNMIENMDFSHMPYFDSYQSWLNFQYQMLWKQRQMVLEQRQLEIYNRNIFIQKMRLEQLALNQSKKIKNEWSDQQISCIQTGFTAWKTLEDETCKTQLLELTSQKSGVSMIDIYSSWQKMEEGYEL